MKLLVKFDVDADIIDVPQSIIDNKELYQRRFLKWLFNQDVKHSYWVTFEDGSKGVCYRSDAFVEWLNMNILDNSTEKAVIIQQGICFKIKETLPSIFF